MDELEAELVEEAVALSVAVTDDESQSETVELAVASLAEAEVSEEEANCVGADEVSAVIEEDDPVGMAVKSDEDETAAVGSDESVTEDGLADAETDAVELTGTDTELFDPGIWYPGG